MEGVLGWDMSSTVTEDSAGGRSLEGLSSAQRCQSTDALAEWRSSDQVENGIPSTSPPYWDIDDSDDDGGNFEFFHLCYSFFLVLSSLLLLCNVKSTSNRLEI